MEVNISFTFWALCRPTKGSQVRFEGEEIGRKEFPTAVGSRAPFVHPAVSRSTELPRLLPNERNPNEMHVSPEMKQMENDEGTWL
jgi:hypothetical protein